MADYCRQCSNDIHLGELAPPAHPDQPEGWSDFTNMVSNGLNFYKPLPYPIFAICEGCGGFVGIDIDGSCVGASRDKPCIEGHHKPEVCGDNG